MQIVILAGGKGTRMGALTEALPKPMLPVKGKPILEYQIELAARYGHRDIILLTGHHAKVIENHFQDGKRWGVRIRYHRETEPLGTAGAIKEIESWLEGDFFVFYGDIMMDVDLAMLLGFHSARTPLATLVVHPNGHPQDSDLLELDQEQRVIAFHPKPRPAGQSYRNLVNAALYVFSREVTRHIAAGQFSDLGRDILPQLVRSNHYLAGYNTSEYIRDIGTWDRLEQVEADVVAGKVERLNRKCRRRAIFLDRDGVLNVDLDPVKSAEQLQLLPGVVEAIRQVNESEYLAVVASNQPAIAKGLLSEPELGRIHARLETLLGAGHAYLDRIYYCPHHPEKGFPGERTEYKVACHCRKPAPGMLVAAAAELNVDLARSWMIGDRTADIRAGAGAGCQTVLVRTGCAGRDNQHVCQPDFVFDDLMQATRFILERER